MQLCKFNEKTMFACKYFNGVACCCKHATGEAQRQLEAAWDEDAIRRSEAYRMTDEEYVMSLDRSQGDDEDYHEAEWEARYRMGYDVWEVRSESIEQHLLIYTEMKQTERPKAIMFDPGVKECKACTPTNSCDSSAQA